MDFIDYQAYTVIDSSVEESSTTQLPEPSSTLNISTFRNDQQAQNETFELPHFQNSELAENNSSKSNLYDRMAEYATLSIDSLKVNGSKPRAPQQQKLGNITQFNEPTKATLSNPDISQFLAEKKSSNTDFTDIVLSKKLSTVLTDYILTNYQTRTQLRKSLHLLEENEDTLLLDEEKLIQSGYIGTLARKTLRSDIENELLKEHLVVLEEFRPIARRIKRLSSSVQNIKLLGENILKKETPDENDNKPIDKINDLRSELDSMRMRKKLLSSMQDHFTLSQIEDELILSGPIDEEFFKIVNKLMAIKEHSTLLLSLQDPRAGNSLLRKLNDLLKFVNRKIFNYLVDFLYSYESNSTSFSEKAFAPNENVLELFQKALIYLSNDLEYFNEFLKKVTTVRSKIVLDEFLSLFDFDAKDSRPITLSAHDPLRYIGDVLANVHSSIANEADFVKSLFKFQDKQIDDAPVTILLQNKEFLNGLDLKLLNEAVQSLSTSCRIRVEQIVRFEEDPVTNLEIVRLLELYQLMFERKGISLQSSLVSSLEVLEEISKGKITEYFTKVINKVSPTDNKSMNDSMPPEWLSDYINKLVELFEAYDRGNVSDSDEEKPIISGSFLSKVVEEPIQAKLIKMIQNEFPLARKSDETRYLLLTMQINCFDLVKSRFSPFATTIFALDEESSRIFKKIDDKLKEFINRMLELQEKLLFQNTGMGLYYNLFNMIFPVSSIQDELDYDMYLSLMDNPLMKLDTIKSKVHDPLNEYLPQALNDLQGNLLFRLTSPIIADEISETCFKNLSQFYINFRRILVHLYPDRKEDIEDILNFSEEEFETLVGIGDIY